MSVCGQHQQRGALRVKTTSESTSLLGNFHRILRIRAQHIIEFIKCRAFTLIFFSCIVTPPVFKLLHKTCESNRCQKNIGVTKLRARKMQTVHLVNCSHLPNLLSATTNLRCIGDDLRGNPMQLLYLRLFHRLTDALNFEPQNTAVKNGVPTRSSTIYQREDRLTLIVNTLP